MTISFVERALAFEFTLGQGQFGTSGSDTVTLQNHRASVHIVKLGSIGDYQAEIRIYGVDIGIMNQLNTLGNQFWTQSYRFNEVTISAGDNQSGLASVFRGTIFQCWIDFDSAPDVALVIMASANLLIRMKPIAPSSYGQPTDVAVIMQNLAAQAGLGFENNGVSVILPYPYLSGTAMQQIDKAARAAGISYGIRASSVGPLVIWQKNGYAGPPSSKYPTYSASSGLMGYPTYTQMGINIRVVYTPGQDPQIGEVINVISSLKPATGPWVPIQIDYYLDSVTPNGRWEMQMQCAAPPNAPNALASAAGGAG